MYLAYIKDKQTEATAKQKTALGTICLALQRLTHGKKNTNKADCRTTLLRETLKGH